MPGFPPLTPLCFVMDASVDSCSGKHETMFKQEFLSMLWLINSISRNWLKKSMRRTNNLPEGLLCSFIWLKGKHRKRNEELESD